MGDFLNTVLYPLEFAVAWIMVTWHSALSALGMNPSSGWTWALSIVGLVIVVRILLIPLFVRQIKASRGLQLLQPQMKKIQEKYKGKTDTASRQAQQQEIMALYRETGTNPFASCLPILLQSPVFFALFRVLNGIKEQKKDIGPLTVALANEADNARLFGAQLSDRFIGAQTLSTQILTIVLIVLMSATTYTTQRQLMMKNMPPAALEGPFAQQQKIMLYVFPLIFAVSGVNFPIGVLIYWLTTNLWTMGQQFYVIRRMPAPGSPAEKALQERRRKHGESEPEAATPGEAEAGAAPGGQRQQPKRQPRSKRTPPAAAGTAAAGPAGAGDGADGVEPAANGTSAAAAASSDAPTGQSPGDGASAGSSAGSTAGGTTSGPATPKGGGGRGGRPGGGQPKKASQPRRGRPSRPKR